MNENATTLMKKVMFIFLIIYSAAVQAQTMRYGTLHEPFVRLMNTGLLSDDEQN